MIKPVAKSLYLCDNVMEVPGSGKVMLINLWDSIRKPAMAAFPFVLDHLHAFVWWRDGEGEIRTRLDIVDAEEEVIFRSRDFSVDFAQRRASVWASYRLDRVGFPAPGYYFVELYCLDEFVDDQIIRVYET